jgi:hypothetical protein
MKRNLSLRNIDYLISFSFFLMLFPIYFGLSLTGLHLKDHLNHFADMLAVLAALYAGRTVFFAPSSNVPTQELHNNCILKQEESATTAPLSAVDKAAATSENACQDVKHSPAANNPDAGNGLPDRATGETPQEVFGVMFAFLIAYAAIKGATYLEPICGYQFWILIILMNVTAGSFLSIAFIRALDDKKVVKLRVILALVFSIISFAISAAAIYFR